MLMPPHCKRTLIGMSKSFASISNSSVSLFVGVFFAYRTYSAGVVTQAEFERLQSGFSLSEANSELGLIGRRMESTAMGNAAAAVYRWENSTLSYVECEFVDGQLVSKKAVKLPH